MPSWLTPGQLTTWLVLALLLANIFAFVDAMLRPAGAFVATGKQTKQFWGILLGILALCVLVGVLYPMLHLIAAAATIIYFVDVRPALRAVGGGGRNRRGGGSSRW